MSSNSNKASAFATIILLATTCTISISAQTPVAVNNLTAKPELLGGTNEVVVEKKAVPHVEGTDITSGPAEAQVNHHSDVSVPC